MCESAFLLIDHRFKYFSKRRKDPPLSSRHIEIMPPIGGKPSLLLLGHLPTWSVKKCRLLSMTNSYA